MENRYFYIDGDGGVQGPFWLSVMRDLWKGGRLKMSTEVSLNGADGWSAIEFHPEIFEWQVKMPALKRMAKAKSDPVRLLVWMILLFLAYVTYVVVNWDSDKRLRFDGGSKSAPAEGAG
jgi:hypothetical protein